MYIELTQLFRFKHQVGEEGHPLKDRSHPVNLWLTKGKSLVADLTIPATLTHSARKHTPEGPIISHDIDDMRAVRASEVANPPARRERREPTMGARAGTPPPTPPMPPRPPPAAGRDPGEAPQRRAGYTHIAEYVLLRR